MGASTGKRVTILVLAGFMASTMLSGCANTKDGRETQAGGAAIGAVLGGVIGGIIGGRDGALIGAGVGAGIGLLAGSEVARRKAEYANEHAFYDAQIANTATYTKELASLNYKLKGQISMSSKEIRQLQTAAAKGHVDEAKAKEGKKRVEAEYASAKKALEDAKKELEVQQSVVAELRKNDNESKNKLHKAENEVQKLASAVDFLEQNVNSLAGLRSSYN